MNMNPRSIWLPVALVLGLAGIVRPETRTFDLITASVSDIQDAVDAGAFSYEKLVEMYLPRIEAYDKNGPKLHAVLAIQLRAIEIARGLDRERIERGWRSPLHGIPIAVKDTVHVKDVTAAGGNLALAGTFPGTTLPWSRSSARPAPSFSSRPTWKSSTSERRAELSRRSGLESLRFDSQSLRLERGPRRRVNAGLRPWPSPPSSSYQTKAAPIRSGREAAASFL